MKYVQWYQYQKLGQGCGKVPLQMAAGLTSCWAGWQSETKPNFSEKGKSLPPLTEARVPLRSRVGPGHALSHLLRLSRTRSLSPASLASCRTLGCWHTPLDSHGAPRIQAAVSWPSKLLAYPRQHSGCERTSCRLSSYCLLNVSLSCTRPRTQILMGTSLASE